MDSTLGKRISALRREKGMKQEELAERMQVSPQAVSKWENDQTCPDISALPHLANILGVSVDELLTGKKDEPIVSVVPIENKNDMKRRVLHLECGDNEDKVRINLPLELINTAVEMGVSLSDVSGMDALKNVDFEKILALADQGVVGNLLEVESADGSFVRIFID